MDVSTIILYLTLFLALFLGAAVTLYMTTDAGKDVMEWVGERFFKYKAKAEEKALEQAGEGQAREFLKGELYIEALELGSRDNRGGRED